MNPPLTKTNKQKKAWGEKDQSKKEECRRYLDIINFVIKEGEMGEINVKLKTQN